ncbi:MAG: class I SAM-dependent methyltransferase [Planctomycetota bacterium]
MFAVNEIPVVNCPTCLHRFAAVETNEAHTRQTFDDAYFTDGDDGYVDYLGEREDIVAVGKRYSKIMSDHIRPGSMLDIGAAAGFVMKGFADAGWEVTGVEPNERMASLANDMFGFNVHAGSLESIGLDSKFDLINMTQVVAHFHDLRAAFQRASQLTTNNGYWLIETWNHRSLTARAFGRMWHEYSPPAVTQWFSPDSLAKLCGQFGMVPVDQGRPRKSIKGDRARSLLAYTMGRVGMGFLNPFTRLIPPNVRIPYPSEDIFWILFRSKP